MATYCTIKPKVRVNGMEEDSNLFSSLKAYTLGDYSSARLIYLSAIHDMKDAYQEDKELPVNSQGELELTTILENFDVRRFLPRDFEKKLLVKYDLEEVPYSVKNYSEALQKCEELNNSIYNTNYFASVEVRNNKIVPIVKWKAKKSSYREAQEAQSRSAQLSSKMLNLLQKWNISVDTLYDAEERLSNGVTDLTSVEKAADGLYHIIRIAKGERGLQALPEELGHTVVTAMLNNSMMQRTLNLIKTSGLAKEILGDRYEEYAQKYQNNEDYLAEEAAGKLMAIHFLQQLGIEDDAVYKQVLNRTVNQAKTFFSRLNETEISNAINEVNGNLSMMTTRILNNQEEIELSSRELGRIYYQARTTQSRIERLKQSLVRILVIENKRYTLYKNSDNYELLKTLNEKIQSNDYKEAILTFLEEANKRIGEMARELDSLNISQNADLNKKAKTLRYFRSTIFSYLKLLQELSTDIRNDLEASDAAFDRETLDFINTTAGVLGSCLGQYNKHARTLVEEYMVPILGDQMVMNTAWFKDKAPIKYTARQVLNMDVDDISLFDMFLDSSSDTSSYLIKGVDQVVKRQHNNARLLAEEFYRKVAARTKKLEREGYKNQDWAFERDSEGNRTGWYISPYHRGNREKAREEYRQSILNGYPEQDRNSTEVKSIVSRAIFEWDRQNPLSNFKNPEYERLSEIQKSYITDIISYKASLDKLLPNNPNFFKTIKIRKDLLERVKGSHSIKDGIKAFSDSIKEGFVRDDTETEFGVKTVLKDFENNTYRELPVFYQNRGKSISEEDISTDIVSTLTAYALMAYENSEMSKVINILETLRSTIRDSENPYKTIGGVRGVEPFRTGTQSYARSENNRILERLNALFDTQIYRERLVDEGTLIGNIDKQKATSKLTQWSSSVTMAFNILNNISNVMTGNIQFKMEAVGGQFFNYKNAVRADALYHKHLADFLLDIGNRTKTSYLWTVSTTFNVMQDYPERLKDVQFDKKFYERLSMNGISMLLQHAGEFWMQHRTFFALLDSDKEALTDSRGNKVKAIDAFEVKPVDPNNPKDGSTVVFKENLTTNKGEKLITKEELAIRALAEETSPTDESLIHEGEISEYDYILRISKKSGKLNDRMHGVYNEEEKAIIYTRSWGRLVGQYRKWIKPSLNRRFKAAQYDYDLETMTEGFYRTPFRLMGVTYRYAKAHGFAAAVSTAAKYSLDVWKKNPSLLEEYESSNLRRVAAELATFALILLCISLIPDDDDEVEETYFSRIYEFELYRLKNEIGTLIPSPYMIKEGLKVLQSPAAAISLLDRAADVFYLFTPWNWKEIESGRYEGWHRPFNTIADLVPYNRAIYRSLHPEQAVQFYK